MRKIIEKLKSFLQLSVGNLGSFLYKRNFILSNFSKIKKSLVFLFKISY